MLSNKTNIKKLLLQDLKIFEHQLSQFSGCYSIKLNSVKSFHEALKLAITNFELGDDSVIDDLWIWFAHRSQRYNFVGDANLRNHIFERIKELK